MKRLQERLAASRFVTFSLLLHTVIVIVGGSLVIFKRAMDVPDIQSDLRSMAKSEENTPLPPDPVGESLPVAFTPAPPVMGGPTLTAITVSASAPTFQLTMPTRDVRTPAVDVHRKLPGNDPSGVDLGVPSAMSIRMSERARREAMGRLGGKPASEDAVVRGLRWLAEHQNADGSWSGEHRSAMTGLAVLCFLGHGELPTSANFGDALRKGIDWLTESGRQNDGRLSGTKNGWGGNGGVYEHAIGTYALAEYYSMTKDDQVADVLKRAVDHIVKGQGTDGGWVYGYTKQGDSDTSVSGWQVQALKAAHLTGLGLPGVDVALDRSMLNFKRVQGDQGGFGYRGAEDRYSLTGVGVLCTYFWKQEKDRMVREGAEFIIKKSKSDYPVKYKGEHANLYAWYYNTQACMMVGAPAWPAWNRMFQDEITNNQSSDGSWPPVGGKGDTGGLGTIPSGAGPCYRTTLCILMLEVYYRYTPPMKGGL